MRTVDPEIERIEKDIHTELKSFWNPKPPGKEIDYRFVYK